MTCIPSYNQSGLWYNRRLDTHVPIGRHLDLCLQSGKCKKTTLINERVFFMIINN